MPFTTPKQTEWKRRIIPACPEHTEELGYHIHLPTYARHAVTPEGNLDVSFPADYFHTDGTINIDLLLEAYPEWTAANRPYLPSLANE